MVVLPVFIVDVRDVVVDVNDTALWLWMDGIAAAVFETRESPNITTVQIIQRIQDIAVR